MQSSLQLILGLVQLLCFMSDEGISQDTTILCSISESKDMVCVHEYAVIILELSYVLSMFENAVELWDTLKFKTLKALERTLGEGVALAQKRTCLACWESGLMYGSVI